jgi:hypothetical protein
LIGIASLTWRALCIWHCILATSTPATVELDDTAATLGSVGQTSTADEKKTTTTARHWSVSDLGSPTIVASFVGFLVVRPGIK